MREAERTSDPQPRANLATALATLASRAGAPEDRRKIAGLLVELALDGDPEVARRARAGLRSVDARALLEAELRRAAEALAEAWKARRDEDRKGAEAGTDGALEAARERYERLVSLQRTAGGAAAPADGRSPAPREGATASPVGRWKRTVGIGRALARSPWGRTVRTSLGAGLISYLGLALLLSGYQDADAGPLALLVPIGLGLSVLLAIAVSARAVGADRYLDRGPGLLREVASAATGGLVLFLVPAVLWGLLEVVLGGEPWGAVVVGAWLVPGAAVAAAAARLGAAGLAGLVTRGSEGRRSRLDRLLRGLIAGLGAVAVWSLLLLMLRRWMPDQHLTEAAVVWLPWLPAWLGAGAAVSGVDGPGSGKPARRRAAALAVVVVAPVLVGLSFGGERRGSVSTVAEITAGGDQQRTGRLAFSDLPSEYGFSLELPHWVIFHVPEEVEGDQDLLLRLYGEPRRPDSGDATGPLPLVGDDPPEIEADLNPGHYRLLVGEFGRVPPLEEEEDGRWRTLVQEYLAMARGVTGMPSPTLARILEGVEEAPGEATAGGTAGEDRWVEVTWRVDTARALREAVPLWLRAKDVEELGRAVSPLVDASRQLPEGSSTAGSEERQPALPGQAGAAAREEWVRVLDSVCRGGSLLSAEGAETFAPACDRAVELAPDNPAVLESAAIQRALQGDRAGAIDLLDSAVEPEGEPAVAGPSEIRAREWLTALRGGGNPFTPLVKPELLEELPRRDPVALEQVLAQKRREAAHRALLEVPLDGLDEAVERFTRSPDPPTDERAGHWTFACWALSLRAETDALRRRAVDLCQSAVEAAIGFSELNLEALALEGQALASLAAENREAAVESLAQADRYAQAFPPPFEGLGSERRRRYLAALQDPDPRNPLTEEERRALLGQLSKWKLFPWQESSSAAAPRGSSPNGSGGRLPGRGLPARRGGVRPHGGGPLRARTAPSPRRWDGGRVGGASPAARGGGPAPG